LGQLAEEDDRPSSKPKIEADSPIQIKPEAKEEERMTQTSEELIPEQVESKRLIERDTISMALKEEVETTVEIIPIESNVRMATQGTEEEIEQISESQREMSILERIQISIERKEKPLAEKFREIQELKDVPPEDSPQNLETKSDISKEETSQILRVKKHFGKEDSEEEEEDDIIDYSKCLEEDQKQSQKKAPFLTTRGCKAVVMTPEETITDPSIQGAEDKDWEDYVRVDNALRKRECYPASPKDKKKNQARRERRKGVHRRLAEEKKKAEERAERIKLREARRKRRANTRRIRRIPYPEDPVRVPIEGKINHWRPLKISDLRTYVIRRNPGKIRRVWVQPTWIGHCSPRKHAQEQSKWDILRFLSYAIKVHTPEKLDWIQEFTENPFFLRPQFLPSGRAYPETAHNWRMEDAFEISKETKNWRSVGERIRQRKEESQKRYKKFGSSPESVEELSYLTVDCDFQDPQDMVQILPERLETKPRKEDTIS
jgi:hypothetical protein